VSPNAVARPERISGLGHVVLIPVGPLVPLVALGGEAFDESG
jgi:hypothetical protein